MTIAFRILLLLVLAVPARAAMLPPEKVLPPETLLTVSIPNLSRLRADFNASAQGRFWNDPAMKPFHDHFLAKLRQELLQPLEARFDLRIDEFSNCFQGSFTLAMVKTEVRTNAAPRWDFLILADAGEKSGQLKKTLADIGRKWFQGGKDVRGQKLAGVDAIVLSPSRTNLSSGWLEILPGLNAAGGASGTNHTAMGILVLAQVESVLVAGSSTAVVERTLKLLQGVAEPCLAQSSAFQQGRPATFGSLAINGWVSAKAISEYILRGRPPRSPVESGAPDGLDMNRLFTAAGLGNFEGLSWGLSTSAAGSSLQAFIANAESSRQGLLKIIAGQPGPATPPPFVPADAVSYQRWRLDGRKTWASLEKMIADTSEQWLSAVHFILDTASQAGRLQDPAFDINTNLVANLGDDLIRYTKRSPGRAGASPGPPEELYVISSPNPGQLAAALKSVLVFLSQQADPPAERAFEGHTIYSVQLASALVAVPDSTTVPLLNYAATSNHVALSTDVRLLEEFLHAPPTHSLDQKAGLAEAFRHVAGQRTSLLGFQNQKESMRLWFEGARRPQEVSSNSAAAAALPFLPGMLAARNEVGVWLDLSLLPPFEPVGKYFKSMVYSGSAEPDGLAFKLLIPAQQESPVAAQN